MKEEMNAEQLRIIEMCKSCQEEDCCVNFDATCARIRTEQRKETNGRKTRETKPGVFRHHSG